jgi:glycine/D-amino acid oxidase-like deaminating enzyme
LPTSAARVAFLVVSTSSIADVAIVGGGVMGAAVAHALSRAGASVLVLEAGEIGDGTSTASFSVDITHVKTPRSYFELAVAAAREHAELVAGPGGAPWYHPAGLIEWGEDERRRIVVRERVERLRAWGHAARWVDRDEVRVLEPHVELPPEAVEVVHFADGAWYDAPRMARALLARAERLGARVRRGARVTEIAPADARGARIGTSSGESVTAARVVVCAGADAANVAALAGGHLPLLRVPGLVVTTSPTPVTLRGIVSAGIDVRAAPGGRLALHSFPLDGELDDEEAGGLAHRLLADARALLPRLRGVTIERARVGVRPVPPDGLPIAGPLPGAESVYALVSHSGVHLAPLLGRLAAEELAGRSGGETLRAFRPERFGDGDGADVEPLDESAREMARRLARHPSA